MDGLITEDDILGEAESSIETALASMVLEPVLGIRKQPGSLCPPSPVYQPYLTRVSGRRNAVCIKDPYTTPEGTKEAAISK